MISANLDVIWGEKIMFGSTRLGLCAFFAMSVALIVVNGQTLADDRLEPSKGLSKSGGYVVEALDLDALKNGLRQTEAIGFASKLLLKSKLEGFVESLHQYHKGSGKQTLETLSERFTDLLDRTLSLLQKDDPYLFQQLLSAREELLATLIDSRTFEAAVGRQRATLVAMRGQR